MTFGHRRSISLARVACIVVALAASHVMFISAPADACTVWTTETGAELHHATGESVKYYIQVDASADIQDPSAVYDAINNAFGEWSNVACGDEAPQLAFEFADFIDTDPLNFDPRLFRDEKNMVTFINDGWEGDPAVLARTRVMWDSATGELMEFGIALNDQYTNWSVNPDGEAGTYDIQSVLMRQIGLIMGLGSSEFDESVMHPVLFENNTDKRTLANDDVIAVCDLYAPGREDWTSAPMEMSCSRDFHPGAQPNPNNATNNDTNNATNNDTNGGNNGDNNDVPANNGDNNSANNAANNGGGAGGVGESCTSDDACMEGLSCGCPPALGSCTTNICYEPAPPPAASGDDDCNAVAPAQSSAKTNLAVFVLCMIALGGVVLRRRS